MRAASLTDCSPSSRLTPGRAQIGERAWDHNEERGDYNVSHSTGKAGRQGAVLYLVCSAAMLLACSSLVKRR